MMDSYPLSKEVLEHCRLFSENISSALTSCQKGAYSVRKLIENKDEKINLTLYEVYKCRLHCLLQTSLLTADFIVYCLH